MTSQNNRAPLLYYIKLCASFQIHRWIQTEVTVRKRSLQVKIGDFLSRVIFKFDGWHWKTIGHLLYTASSFLHHFKAMVEFKLEFQSENHQFGSKSAMFILYDLEIWLTTLKKHRTHLLSCFKLCASLRSHQWIRTGVTVRNRPIWVKIDDFFSHVTLKFDGWLWKTIGHLIRVASSFVHHLIAISEFKLELQSGNAHFGSKSTTFFSRVILKFDRWSWKTIGHLF